MNTHFLLAHGIAAVIPTLAAFAFAERGQPNRPLPKVRFAAPSGCFDLFIATQMLPAAILNLAFIPLFASVSANFSFALCAAFGAVPVLACSSWGLRWRVIVISGLCASAIGFGVNLAGLDPKPLRNSAQASLDAVAAIAGPAADAPARPAHTAPAIAPPAAPPVAWPGQYDASDEVSDPDETLATTDIAQPTPTAPAPIPPAIPNVGSAPSSTSAPTPPGAAALPALVAQPTASAVTPTRNKRSPLVVLLDMLAATVVTVGPILLAHLLPQAGKVDRKGLRLRCDGFKGLVDVAFFVPLYITATGFLASLPTMLLLHDRNSLGKYLVLGCLPAFAVANKQLRARLVWMLGLGTGALGLGLGLLY